MLRANSAGFEALRNLRTLAVADFAIDGGAESAVRGSAHGSQGQIAILRQGISEFEEEIKGLQAQQGAQAKQIALLRDEYKGVKQLYGKRCCRTLVEAGRWLG